MSPLSPLLRRCLVLLVRDVARPGKSAMMVYRKPVSIVLAPEAPEPLHQGGIWYCPACGTNRRDGERSHANSTSYYAGVEFPRVCYRRSKIWLWWRCPERRPHLHQRCTACGHRWIVGFVNQERT